MSDADDTDDTDAVDTIEIPIDGTLDLHNFLPREIKELLPDYLTECRARGILEVRVVHGKGTGVLRRTVHAILGKLPYVVDFGLAGGTGGSWGATLVTLAPPTDAPQGQ